MKTALQNFLGCGLASLAALSAQARINVDTLPGRDTTQLTIYNSVDLTMVRETRSLTLRKGLNRLEFSWANTLIDPTSVEFKALSHAGEVEIMDASFPPRVTNTLEWRVQSDFSGEVQVEIRYFTSGINWAADYVLEADGAEKAADLAGYVRVTNQSGEDYENAQVRLVVGHIRLVEDIARLAGAGHPTDLTPRSTTLSRQLLSQAEDLVSDSFALAEEKPKQVIKEGLSEYFLYTVEGRESIPNGWSQRLRSFQAPSVPMSSYYKFEAEQRGQMIERYYRFKNNQESNLGTEPLPNGQVTAFRSASNDGLRSLAGQTSVKYIPVNEDVEMDLGADPEVQAKPMLKDWRKTDLSFDKNGNVAGWTVAESWSIETQNSKKIPVTVDLRRNFSGDWAVNSGSVYEKVDATKIKFILQLQPREKKNVTYEVTTRFGNNANR